MKRKAQITAAIVALSALAIPALAGWRGFKFAHLLGDTYSVSYTPKSVFGKVPATMQYLTGSSGELCLQEKFSYARLYDVGVGDKYDGIKQVTGMLELAHHPGEGFVSCWELVKKPTGQGQYSEFRGKRPKSPQGGPDARIAAEPDKECTADLCAALRALGLSSRQVRAVCGDAGVCGDGPTG